MTHDHTKEPPPVGSVDYHREAARTNPDIAALVSIIDKQQQLLVKALEALIKEYTKRDDAVKILTAKAS